jgi:membrane protein
MRDIREVKSAGHFLAEVFRAWSGRKTPRLGAALAYYTIFAIAPLFLIALSMAGFFFGEEAARKELFGQIYGLVGQDGGEAIQSLVAAANRPNAGLWATIGALVTLGAGATAVFIELQDALNTIWGAQRKAGGGLRYFIKDRLLSFAMVLGVGFLLLVSLMLNAAVAGLGRFTGGVLTEHHLLWAIVEFLVSSVVITLLFAMIFKFLPDVSISWSDVWMGSFVTAMLFNLGKLLIGYYLGRSSMVSIYGAAGSFIILLLWVYYSAQILFFGAEFTRLDAAHRAKQRGIRRAPAGATSSRNGGRT